MTLRLCALLWAATGREPDLHRYEDSVLALLADHEGRVISRNRVHPRTTGDPTEVQIIEFPSEAAMDSYISDPRRIALNAKRDAAIARTQLLNLV